MNTIRGSILLKSAALILQQIFILIISLTILVGVTYWNYENASFDAVERDDFTETNYYKRLVEENIYSLLNYIDYCGKFESNGGYDSLRIVDINDYILNDRITNEVTISLGYTIEQLLEWKKDGFFYHTESIVIPNDTNMPPEEGAVPSTETAITVSRLNEPFPNSSGLSLSAYATSRNLDYQDLCNSIENAANKLESEIIEYKTQVSSFKSNNTNLRYAIMDNDNSVFYTNLNTNSIEEGINTITQLGSYVLLDSTKADFTSNLFYAKENLNHYLNTLYLENKSCILVIGVDTTFPVLDTFSRENRQYQNMEGWFQILVKLLIISILGFIISSFYLSAAAGHKKNSSQLVLTPLEKIKTELAILFICIPEIILYHNLVSIFSGGALPAMNLMNLVRIGSIILSMSIIFTTGYLSLLRRLKLGTLLTNSFIYFFYCFIKKLFANIIPALKVLITYGVFLLFLFLSMAFSHPFKSILLFIICLLFGIYLLLESFERRYILNGIKRIVSGDLEFQINTQALHHENKTLGENINKISEGFHNAVETSIHNERLKTDLITNVSHDIKTPLTSIINYVTLLKRTPIENEQIIQYINILEEKSQRLKHLTEDLVEASKISSGNITLTMERLNFVELIHQTSGEFTEKFEKKNLTLITTLPDEAVMIEADGRRIWRVLENIYNNAEKYAMENTRIYADLSIHEQYAVFSLKNISSQPLNIKAEELTKRFIRGDISRSTEGSGLGLSIAKNLTELQNGIFEIYLDGDLFRATIRMPCCE